MVSHSDNKNWATIDIFATKSVFSWLVDFSNNGFISADFIGSVFLKPFNPLTPLFDNFFSIKLSCNWEPCNGVYVCVEMFSLFTVLIFFSKDFLNLVLIWLNLSKLRVRDSQRIVRIHLHHFIIISNNIYQKYKSHLKRIFIHRFLLLNYHQ